MGPKELTIEKRHKISEIAWSLWDDFVDYVPGTEPGDWQPTEPMFIVALDPHWAALEPWAMAFIDSTPSSASRHVPSAPRKPFSPQAYCVIELLPPLLVLFLATRRSARARRIQRGLVRVITRSGPMWVRALCLGTGVVLVFDALLHSHSLW